MTATAPPADPSTTRLDDERAVAVAVARTGQSLRRELSERIVGLDSVVEQVLITVLTRNHALLEGVPGLAKTLLLASMAEMLDLEFSRIQFTPDLMPSDITGSEYLLEDPNTGERVFRFAKGPVFANLVLADEINRAPPKTQAALMEAMEELQVTSLGESRPLADPFIVLATQNPIEQEGTYPLPAAQLDRFLFKVLLDYPDYQDERAIARMTVHRDLPPLDRTLDRDQFREMADAVQRIEIPAPMVRYAVELAQASRPESPNAPGIVKEYVEWGAGPRAAQGLVVAAKARALLRGRSRPEFEDICALAPAVFRHRIRMSYAAEADGVSADRLLNAMLEHVPYPGRPLPSRRAWWRRIWDMIAKPAA